MSKKRNIDEALGGSRATKQVKFDDNVKKHTLDSDEEDNDDQYNVLDENDIEGEEEGAARQDGDTRMTAFNMQEEMEMGHFDRDGHFIWNNEKEVRDNWLDNIDWHKVKDKTGANPYSLESKGLGDESESEEEMDTFNEIDTYKKIITYLKPKESINKALRRLGGDSSKLSTMEKLKRKKAGTLGSSKEVNELTELANEVLTQLGNMDVYQETFEQISLKLDAHDKKNKSKAKIVEAELDMYSDDFDKQEKGKIVGVDGAEQEQSSTTTTNTAGESSSSELMWEFKWEQDKEKIEGPFDTLQMNKWQSEGHFKTGVWVRKCGSEDANFYSSSRIDFELYL
ncbi:PREDICTED: CD2 antigen cytoplasmic tail-binding protein 2 homolog [Nicrophorus vespilloides]|uniref:CD2 antigen cytoplasmic tail-binding protein 2 homolog n=1 Tax=Nicrophorus vespilloides TaxID=110193 RepID=A0ABM1MSW4_NICVS|nr:PREDICTED: CD2 antigen cytoplasmic tail-binding protein 2 homolog [Nicrophorus vespilloides]